MRSDPHAPTPNGVTIGLPPKALPNQLHLLLKPGVVDRGRALPKPCWLSAVLALLYSWVGKGN